MLNLRAFSSRAASCKNRARYRRFSSVKKSTCISKRKTKRVQGNKRDDVLLTIVPLFKTSRLQVRDETLFNVRFHLFDAAFVVAFKVLFYIVGHFQFTCDSRIRIFSVTQN